MQAVVLADFGSTFTKVTVVEEPGGRLLASAQSPTTVESDVMHGYETALAQALRSVRNPLKINARLAASSAGGGLRLAAIGLVPDYTAAAARQAALNAGAKVELLLSDRLDASAIAALQETRPEILLFSGGTDGGQRDEVLFNAEVAASANLDCHVVVACNRDLAQDVARRFAAGGRGVDVVDNVLPEIRTLNIEPARAAIREAFIRHVIRGKGLSATEEFGRTVIMPTPQAVLTATRLLALGDGGTPGVGDVVVVDVGGATTDVHSAAALRSTSAGITSAGLPLLPLTRTVQGDLGMRWSAPGVLDADYDWLVAQEGATAQGLKVQCGRRRREPAMLADDEHERRTDRALATACITHALRRHCGVLDAIYIPGQGTDFVRKGLDLREVPLVVGTGGMLVHDRRGAASLRHALSRRVKQSLTPRDPVVALDRRYLLPAAGLLSTRDARAALALLRAHVAPKQTGHAARV